MTRRCARLPPRPVPTTKGRAEVSAALARRAPVALDIEKARALLAESTDLDQIRKLRDQAEAIGRFLRAHGAAEETALEATAFVIRAERRLGEMCRLLTVTMTAKKRRNGERVLPEQVDHNESKRWQAIESIPEKRFESELTRFLEEKKFPTQSAFLRLARELRNGASDAPEEPFHPLVALGELKDRLIAVLEAKVADWPAIARQNIPGMLRDLAADLERRYQ